MNPISLLALALVATASIAAAQAEAGSRQTGGGGNRVQDRGARAGTLTAEGELVCGENQVARETSKGSKCRCANGFMKDTTASESDSLVCIAKAARQSGRTDEVTETDLVCGENQIIRETARGSKCKCANGFRKDDAAPEADGLACVAKVQAAAASTFCKSGRLFTVACTGCRRETLIWTRMGDGDTARGKCVSADWQPWCKNGTPFAGTNCVCRGDKTWVENPNRLGKGRCILTATPE